MSLLIYLEGLEHIYLLIVHSQGEYPRDKAPYP